MLMTQVLADAYHCEASIEDGEALMAAALAAAAAVGATVIGETTIRYVPHGLTVAVFLAESHLVLTVDEIVRRLCPAGEVVRQRIPRHIADWPDAAAAKG